MAPSAASDASPAAPRSGLLRIRDDAGREHGFAARMEIARLADANDSIHRLNDRLTVIAMEPPMRVKRTIAIGLLLGIGVLALMELAMLFDVPAQDNIWIPVGLSLAAVVGCFVRVARRRAGPLGDALAAAVVEEGLCAACAYPLAGVPAAEGLVTCPECGAAWRHDRIARFADLAPDPCERTLRRSAATVVHSSARGWQRRRVFDARGSPRAVIPLRRASRLAATATGERRERLDAAVRELRPVGRTVRWAVAASVLLVAALALSDGLPPLQVPALTSLLPLVGGVFGGLSLVACFWSVLWSDLGRAAARVMEEFLARRLCPVCATDLPIAPAGPGGEGLHSCPQCGAAWRLPGPRGP